MSKSDRPTRRRISKKQQAEEYIRQKLAALKANETGQKVPKLEEIEEDLRAEFRPDDILETTMVEGMASAMWHLRYLLRLQLLANISAEEILQYPGLISVLEEWERRRSLLTRSFERNLKELRKLQKDRQAGMLLGAPRVRRPAPPAKAPENVQPEDVPEAPPAFSDEEMAGSVDPATGKKKPWIN